MEGKEYLRKLIRTFLDFPENNLEFPGEGTRRMELEAEQLGHGKKLFTEEDVIRETAQEIYFSINCKKLWAGRNKKTWQKVISTRYFIPDFVSEGLTRKMEKSLRNGFLKKGKGYLIPIWNNKLEGVIYFEPDGKLSQNQEKALSLISILCSREINWVKVKRELELRERDSRELADFFRIILNNQIIGVFVSTVKYPPQFKYVNETLSKMLNFSPEELKGKEAFSIYYPQDRKKAKEAFKKKISGDERETEYHARLLKKNGKIVWSKIFSIISKFKGEEQIIATVVDVTDERRFKERLEEEIRKTRFMNKMAEEGLKCGSIKSWMLDLAKGTFELLNLKGLWVLGSERETIFSYTGKEYSGKIPDKLQEGIVSNGRFVFIPAPSQERLVIMEGKREFDEQNLGFLKELSILPKILAERNTKEQELRKERGLLSLIFNGVQEGLFIAKEEDGDLVIQLANSPINILFGKAEGKNLAGFLPEKTAKHLKKVIEIAKRKGKAEKEIELKIGEGKRIFHISLYPTEAMGKTLIAGILRDITKEKAIEEERKRNERFMTLGEISAGAAHDFNNVLNTIANLSQTALNGPQEEREKYLRKIVDFSLKSASLPSKILKFGAKAPEGGKKIIDLGAWLENEVELLRRLMGKRIKIELSCEKGAILNANDSELSQALLNIVKNSADAIKGTGKIKMEVKKINLEREWREKFPLLKGRRYALLSVEDNGKGIKKEFMGKIFTPFFTTKKEGTGLGLIQVYKTVVEHGGNLKVESQEGKGTRIEIVFPLWKAKTGRKR